MLVHCMVTPSSKLAVTHLYTWVKRGTVRLRDFVLEHNAVPRLGIERLVQTRYEPCLSITLHYCAGNRIGRCIKAKWIHHAFFFFSEFNKRLARVLLLNNISLFYRNRMKVVQSNVNVPCILGVYWSHWPLTIVLRKTSKSLNSVPEWSTSSFLRAFKWTQFVLCNRKTIEICVFCSNNVTEFGP